MPVDELQDLAHHIETALGITPAPNAREQAIIDRFDIYEHEKAQEPTC